MDLMLKNKLLAAAKEAAERSYSPYSKFKVGAAVLTKKGDIFSAPNIENASYGLAMCAERNAVFQAVSAGILELKAILVYTPTIEIYTPCGACRQVITEFSEDIEVICVSDGDGEVKFSPGSLLPQRFKL